MKIPRPGLILIDKPAGITSFKLLGPVKKASGTKKVGHAGTLDKFASGLMLVFVGQATRFVQYLTGADKEYLAEISFGIETETLDPEGAVIRECETPTRASFEGVIPRFIGEIEQKPPMFSAVHIDGKRAYKRALAGEVPEMPTRRVTIKELELLKWNESGGSIFATIRVSCSKGTYIRSLARDMASAAGSCGHLSSLRRLRVGSFSVEDAHDPDTLSVGESLSENLLWGRALIDKIPGIRALELDKSFVPLVANGKPLESGEGGFPAIDPGLYCLIDGDDRIRALVERMEESPRLAYRGVFN